jgi:hypothetical protein
MGEGGKDKQEERKKKKKIKRRKAGKLRTNINDVRAGRAFLAADAIGEIQGLRTRDAR